MILEGVSPVGWLLAAAAAAAYAVLALAARRIGPVYARRVMLLAWALHAALLAWDLLHGQPHFGFAQALSVTAWLVLTVYVVESRLYPQLRARWALAGFGAVTVLLSVLFPGAALPATTSALLPLHWALGIAAYGLMAAAVIHGWMMNRLERQMRQRRPARQDEEGGVPLLTLERLMFRFVGAGFVLLTLTMLVGLFFGGDGAWRWDHKRVFTLLSWLVFAVLLAGRWWLGWRGRRAVHMLYAGSVLLLLGYAGSRFVLEVLLGRTP